MQIVNSPSALLPALIIDDDRIIGKIAVAIFHRLGLRAEQVGSGREGICRAQSQPWCALLIDAQLPDMSGQAVAAELRSAFAARFQNCPPMLGWTATLDAQTEQAFLASGVCAVIEKPLTSGKLRHALEAHTSISWQGHSTAAVAPVNLVQGLDAVIEDSQIQEYLGFTDGHSLLRQLIEILQHEGPKQIGLMQEALQAADALALAKAAHRLKGCSRGLGLTRLTVACGELERLARAGRMPEQRLIKVLDTYLQQSFEVLTHYKQP